MFQDKATEVILTLGQAFEVAYQMALRDQVNKGHTRSQSANHIRSPASDKISNGVTQQPQPQHARSHSVNEIKLNGHQLSLAPALSASTEDFSSETRTASTPTQV